MTYREWAAAPALAARVACVWSAGNDGVARTETVVPDGCIDLIWSASERSVHVAGPDTAPFLARLPPGERLAAVRFRPGAAPDVLGVPADVLRDGRVPLTELWGYEAERVAELVEAAADGHRALEALVADQVLAAGPPVATTVVAAAAMRDGVTVRDLAADVGLSERHLLRRCLDAFGYGPKVLQRILRFQQAKRLIEGGSPLAGAAVAAGYADQAHLTREVRRLAGVAPSALAQASNRP